jgi:hypothetical protein
MSLTASFKSNKSNKEKLLTSYDIYTNCYNQYKREYANDEDFSIKSCDITAEIDDIINEYDERCRKATCSVLSDFLDQLEVSFDFQRNTSRKFSEVNRRSVKVSDLNINLINDEDMYYEQDILLKDEDFMLTCSDNIKRMPYKTGSLVSSSNDLLSQGSAFRNSVASRRHTNQSYIEIKIDEEEKNTIYQFNSDEVTNTIEVNKSVEITGVIKDKPLGIVY